VSLIVLLVGAALVTAVLSAMAGMGGGTILIALMFALGMHPAMALPLHAGVQFASNATRSVAYGAYVHWRALGLFALTAVPGPFLVAPWVVDANPDWIRLILAVFVVFAVWPSWAQRLKIHGRVGLLTAGAIAGVIGPVVGATGMLVAPFFLRDDWRKEQIIATLAVAQSGSHLLKIGAFSLNGFDVFERLDLLLPMAGAALIGTLIGRRLSGVFSERGFRQAVRAIMIVLALRLAWTGLAGLFAV